MLRMIDQKFETELKILLDEINHKYDYDFRQYTSELIKRRIIQAMDQMGCKNLTELKKNVLNNSDSFYDLLEFLTVSVTEIFRDPAYFMGLRQKVMPILKTYPSLKIWVAGCSTGEEVYSLAILLQEEDLLERTILYATDINPQNLKIASSGVFNLKKNKKFIDNYELSGGNKKFSDYYTTDLNSVKFNKDLRKKIIFLNHSLVTDSVFSETHLISCRNVLIYFNRELQNKTIGLFHESLYRRGFLGLGSKETIQFTQYEKYFKSVIKNERIYQKI